MWKGEGERCSHSSAALIEIEGEIIGRCERRASQRIKIKYKVATKDAVEPNEEITFHSIKVSG